jgi:hypothetical protein
MEWWLWAFLAVVGALMLWGAISPRGQWNTLSAWAYRNAEANEPSDASYMVTRIVNIVGLLVLAGLAYAIVQGPP